MAVSKTKSPGLWQPPVPVRYLLLAAGLITLVFLMQELVSYSLNPGERPFAWFFISAATASTYLAWALLSPLLSRISSSIYQSRFSAFRILKHLLLSLPIAILHRLTSSLILFCIFFLKEGKWYGGWDTHTYSSIAINVFSSFVVYWVIIGVFLAVRYYQQLQAKQLELVRMENALNNAQLSALKMQLHPHFLFNTLHTISSLIDEDSERAQKMLSQIGLLLRTILDQDQDQKQSIPVQDELAYIRSYLDIEQTRFRDRLTIEYNIASETRTALVPNLILQPLVENAIKHGFSRQIKKGTIRISSQRDKDSLLLTVQDNGKGMPEAQLKLKTSTGIGISNIRKRLQQMYPDQYTLLFSEPTGGGFLASLRIPFREKE